MTAETFKLLKACLLMLKSDLDDLKRILDWFVMDLRDFFHKVADKLPEEERRKWYETFDRHLVLLADKLGSIKTKIDILMQL